MILARAVTLTLTLPLIHTHLCALLTARACVHVASRIHNLNSNSNPNSNSKPEGTVDRKYRLAPRVQDCYIPMPVPVLGAAYLSGIINIGSSVNLSGIMNAAMIKGLHDQRLLLPHCMFPTD